MIDGDAVEIDLVGGLGADAIAALLGAAHAEVRERDAPEPGFAVAWGFREIRAANEQGGLARGVAVDDVRRAAVAFKPYVAASDDERCGNLIRAGGDAHDAAGGRQASSAAWMSNARAAGCAVARVASARKVNGAARRRRRLMKRR